VSTKFKIIRQIVDAKGTVSNRSGDSENVVFSLVQHQKIIDGVPSTRSASGDIRFKSRAANSFFPWGEPVLLSGGGIEAKIILETADTFIVMGPVNDVA
jgi:hypothetical protein